MEKNVIISVLILISTIPDVFNFIINLNLNKKFLKNLNFDGGHHLSVKVAQLVNLVKIQTALSIFPLIWFTDVEVVVQEKLKKV